MPTPQRALVYIANIRIPSEKAHPYQIVQMCAAFAEAGATVTLWYANRTNPHPNADDFWSHYDIAPIFIADGLPCLDLFPVAKHFNSRVKRLAHRVAAILQLLTFNLSVLVHLGKRQPETTIYSRDPITLWLITLVRPQRARQCFFEAHTYPETNIGLKIRQQLAKTIGGVVVITEALRQRYRELGFLDAHMLTEHDGVNLARFTESPSQQAARQSIAWPTDAFIVGYLGRLVGGLQDMDKGLDTLVEAVEGLRLKHPSQHIKLALVGGPNDFILKLLDKHPNLAVYLLAPGQVLPTKIVAYIAAFDVCTIPSPWNDFFAYYTSPLKLFEYMASMRPIVATALPSTQEVLSNHQNALLVPPSDPDALQDALSELLTREPLRKKLAEQAFADVQYYTWESRAERIFAWVDQLTG